MKYSDKYEITNTKTLAGIDFNTTEKLKNLYSVNEPFDNSIIFTNSDFLETLNLYPNFNYQNDDGYLYDFFDYVDRLTHKFKNINRLNNDKLKTGICFIFSQNLSNPEAFFNWGKYTNTGTGIHNDSDNFVFLKNLNLKDFVFYVETSNSNKINNIASDTLNWEILGSNSIRIRALYWSGSEYVPVNINPALAIYDNEQIYQITGIQPLLSQNNFLGSFYNSFDRSYLYRTISNRLKKYDDHTQMILLPDFPINDIILKSENNDNLYKDNNINLRSVKYSDYTRIDTYLSNKFISNFLASIGCYFTDYDLYTHPNKNFDWLLQNGHLWLGEMIDGKTTGKWLHTIREIYLAENYDINSENEKYQPTKQTEKDSIENMIPFSYFNYSEGGFCKHYAMTAETLESLSNEISDGATIPDGMNVFDNIVQLQAIPFEISDYMLYTTKDNIKIGEWTATTEAVKITAEKTFNTLCDFVVTRKYNDFRDYTPYVIYQLYLPMYGLVNLPDTVVGRRIIIKRNNNIVQGDFTYLICLGDEMSNVDIIDRITVKCTSTMEFNSINASLKRINILQNQLSTANSLVSGISSIATGNVFGVANSVTNIASSIINTDIAKNQSYMSHNSTNTSIAGLHDVDCIFLVAQYSTFVNNDNYGHTVGYVYNKSDVLINHSGYCICNNADIQIHTTEDEKQIIKDKLENGFFI